MGETLTVLRAVSPVKGAPAIPRPGIHAGGAQPTALP